MNRRARAGLCQRQVSRPWLIGLAVPASLIIAGCAGTPAAEDEQTGDTATGSVVEGSSRPWDEARARGVEFRAVGQEPGWSLDLDQGRSILYNGDYGQVQLTMPAPEPTRDSAGVVTYRVQTDSFDLAVMIREEPCQDVMSGEAFTHTVTIRLDGRELAGCGRTLSTGEVGGTYWRLTELDGRPAVPGAGTREPHIRLLADSSRVTGSTGCNRLTGQVELRGDSVSFGPIATTRMACTDPALMSQEQGMLRALERADGVAVQGDTLILEASRQPLARFTAVYLR